MNIYTGLFAMVVLVLVAIFFIGGPKRSLSGEKRRKAIRRLEIKRRAINAKLEDYYGSGTQCPNCKRWPWDNELGKQPIWEDSIRHSHSEMVCQICDYRSYWVAGPVLIEVSPPHIPIDIGS